MLVSPVMFDPWICFWWCFTDHHHSKGRIYGRVNYTEDETQVDVNVNS